MRTLASRSTLMGWAVALLLLLAGEAAAQTARVLGRVTDGVGRAVEGAEVTLVPADSSRPALTTRSGPTGGFEFAAVPAGEYTLQVESPGHPEAQVPLSLKPGERRTLVSRLGAGRPRGSREEREMVRGPAT